MNYVITGSTGNISKKLAEKLIAAGHPVTIISSRPSNKKAIEQLGAKAAIGSVEDLEFLKTAFRDADAVYTMVPPFFSATDWKNWIGQVGKNYADAIRNSPVKYVVNLSSIGADLPDGCGPVSGLHRAEQYLNTLEGIQVRHLRPSYFFDNLLANVSLVKNPGIMGNNFGEPGFKLVLTDVQDIADVAFEELSTLGFTGKSVRYIASDERLTDDIAKLVGAEIGQPSLPWVLFSDEQAKQGMLQAGLPEEVADNYTEMGAALRTGIMQADYWKNRPAKLGKQKLEDFVKTFAAVYNETSSLKAVI